MELVLLVGGTVAVVVLLGGVLGLLADRSAARHDLNDDGPAAKQVRDRA